MAFDSWSAFVAMGGYGEYVWLAYGVSLLAWLALGLYLVRLKRTLKQRLFRQIQLEKVMSRSCS